jgi:acetoin utilization deacetylase AcuC-like enzyme
VTGTGPPLVITHPASLLHRAPGHPESPARIEAIEAAIANDEELAALPRLTPPPATRAQVEAVHRPAHVATIMSAGRDADTRGEGGWLDPDTWIGPGSLEAAFAAAGGAVAAVEAVLAGRHRQAVSLCRPPGHHATRDAAMGFCLFNNIAVGAQAALDSGLERVAIIDFDVHHGNGTEDIFLQRSDVFYMSCHQWPLYPMTGTDERGRGEGAGYTLNAPMSAGVGLAEYLDVFDSMFAPALRDYQPQLIMASAGFDAHQRDPLAGMNLTTPDFGALAERIMGWSDELCEGRSVWCLEGGYDLEALAGSVAIVLRTGHNLTHLS